MIFFDELTEGMKALAESQHGKRTLRTHPSIDVTEAKNGIEMLRQEKAGKCLKKVARF